MRACLNICVSIDWCNFKSVQWKFGNIDMEFTHSNKTAIRNSIDLWLVLELVLSGQCQCIICSEHDTDDNSFCELLLLHHCHLRSLWSVDGIVTIWIRTNSMREKHPKAFGDVAQCKGETTANNWNAYQHLRVRKLNFFLQIFVNILILIGFSRWLLASTVASYFPSYQSMFCSWVPQCTPWSM